MQQCLRRRLRHLPVKHIAALRRRRKRPERLQNHNKHHGSPRNRSRIPPALLVPLPNPVLNCSHALRQRCNPNHNLAALTPLPPQSLDSEHQFPNALSALPKPVAKRPKRNAPPAMKQTVSGESFWQRSDLTRRRRRRRSVKLVSGLVTLETRALRILRERK